ncbi:MAG: twin-arginine translocation signal domain-containing protein, partial [Acidimicrobiaceae bacterium]
MRCEDFSRRDFLKLTGAGAMAASVPLSFFDIAAAGAATPLPAKTPIVVLVTLYGGNDGLNTLVPYLDSTYYSSRPGISVDQSTVLPLGDGLGFNPAMQNFQSLWNAKQLTIVRGVSYPKPDLS